MSLATLISVEEYLQTAYEPDCEYVDGRVIERNVGGKTHNKLQVRLAVHFHNNRVELGAHVFTEQRMRVKADRYRIPDVCIVVGSEPDEEVFINPPYLCIEILSPDDRAPDVFERVKDLQEFGVPYVWVINPVTWNGWCYQPDGRTDRIQDGKFTVPFEVAMKEL